MRSAADRRRQAAQLSAGVAFIFFTLVWYFAAGFGLAMAIGLAVIMAVAVLLPGLYPARRDRR
jgi:hypothetical protein